MKVILTDDGSKTIYLEEIEESYHSRHGAIRESMHVFIKNGFRYLSGLKSQDEIHIFELGFGTGLNALLTAIESLKFKIPVKYTSLEPFPLPDKIIHELNYGQLLQHPGGRETWRVIHKTEWNRFNKIHPFFLLKKIKMKIEDFEPSTDLFDLVYFDAFAPNKQPEIWEKEILQKIFDISAYESVFVTYSAQGKLKRNLHAIGYDLHSLQGPPGKKEMVRGLKSIPLK